jgi:hypothetical protein
MTVRGRAAVAIRTLLAVLAGVDLGTGIWAVAAPSDWYLNFPGFGHHWVSSAGLFNEHLTTDAGAGFLAVGAVLALAAVWAARPVLVTALVALVAQTLPHFIFHLAHPNPLLSTADTIVGVWGIGAECLIGMVLLAVVLVAPPGRAGVSPQGSLQR